MEKEKTQYLHIKYSHDGKTFSENNGKEIAEWLGQYTDDKEEDSNNFETYEWVKLKVKKEIVHLLKETELIEKKENTTRYIEKYYDLNNELLFTKEIEVPNSPVFVTFEEKHFKFDKDGLLIE